jgi:hypothetical protein
LSEASPNLVAWQAVATNTLSASGVLRITDPQATAFSLRDYRAVKAP